MFDRYVVARTKVSWGRRALIFASLFLHVGAGVGLMIWSFFHVEEIVPPAMSLTVFSAPPPPPPPPPPAAHKKSPEHTTPKVIPHEIVQPTSVQKIVQPKEEVKKEEDTKDEPDGEEGGEEGGVAGGVKGGVKGGVVGGQLGGQVGGTGTDIKAAPPAPKVVPQFMFDRERVKYPDPHLPEWFTAQHPHQTVQGMYRICVRTDGRISDVIPMTSIQGMDQLVIEHLKANWVYKPQPVPVCSPRVFRFQIN